ncbi:hypothetical protein [Simkania negevensis]|uniref:Uncharacterized protein n=1 Tax=Simkania negevensis (strain ATCC VR-1471 / DSM 27360 / Z) TaxID=331113 RepID=F8L3J2_SIMNZ|nr:hypothetical protein [Simkania negevensis]CCB89851.1 unknown protein [Simkania negevensis Z]
MADNTLYYTTQQGWETQQDEQWDKMMTKMDSLPPQAALEYFFVTMVQFLFSHFDGLEAWAGYDMNASSGLETILSNITHDVNMCESGNGSTETVDDAVSNMNAFLVQEYTDPALTNDQLITQSQNSGEDLLGSSDNYTVTKVTYDVYYDGSDSPTEVAVPQITSYNANAILADWDGQSYSVPGTSEVPEGNGSPEINPTDQGYQAYLTEQSQWTNDLTTVDDSCGEIDQMAQAEYSQVQSEDKTLMGTDEDGFNNFVKNQSYWNQQIGNS